jgi:hypothetical protein
MCIGGVKRKGRSKKEEFTSGCHVERSRNICLSMRQILRQAQNDNNMELLDHLFLIRNFILPPLIHSYGWGRIVLTHCIVALLPDRVRWQSSEPSDSRP